jgi:hypothetical protein
MFRNLLTKLFAVVLPLTLLVVATGGFQAVAPAFATNTIYYVDCAAGNDANNGTSTATAWRTIGRAGQPTYGAGDQILLKRGCVWTGVSGTPETFLAKGSGSVASRITLADYGTGDLPKIDAYNAEAVKLENVQNWTVRNLDLTQHDQMPQAMDSNNEHGKDVTQGSDAFMHPILLVRGLGASGVQACGEPCTVRNVTLDTLRVHDGTWNGIYIVGGHYELTDNLYGYIDNVVVQNSELWNNEKAGVEFTDTYTKNITYGATNVQLLDSYLHHNGGDGVMMGPVNHGTIDGNDCSYNGWLRNARLGCWSWDSNDVVSQFNEAYHNMSAIHDSHTRDGGGFDLDLGTEDSVMQYDWSHDNEGEGYLLMTWPIGFGYNRGTTHNAQLRYSVSERDAKGHGTSIFMFGDTHPAWVYNNTVYYEPNRLAGSTMYQAEGAAIGFSKWGKSGTPIANVYNNIFIANGTVNPNAVSNLARDESTCVCTINRNVWYRAEGGLRYDWNGSIITTFAGWQAKGYDANGVAADPQINGTLGAGPSAYQLKSTSPAIGIGQTVASPRGMGTRDYFGDTIPQSGTYDAGFDEYSGTFSSANSLATPAAHYVPSLPTVHNSDIWTTNSSGVPTSTFAGGSTVYWKVKMVNSSGTGIAGITVKSIVLNHSWNGFMTAAPLSAVTDASGVASFSGTADTFAGQNWIVVTGVSTPTSYYYDSAQNADFIQAYTVQ